MSNVKKIFMSWQIWLLLLVLLGSIVAISPKFDVSGALIKKVDPDSTAEINGMSGGEIITEVNGRNIETLEDYKLAVTSLTPGVISVKTNRGDYSLVYSENESLGITVDSVPVSNLKKGLDLAGGVRVLLAPEEEITAAQFQDAIEIAKKRLNVYGLSDITVRQTSDFSGNEYILIEASGATREEIRDLVVNEGKFEARIKNQTVFVGGTDIKGVCRTSECSGIDPQRGCGQVENYWVCQFQFRVDVSPESAKKHQEITAKLPVVRGEGNQQYLNETLDLFLDNELVDSLFISSDLKGVESTSFVIQGPGRGDTKEAAVFDALASMKKLQTVLITGSLPTKFKIENINSVSPVFGRDFFQSALITILIAILSVSIVVYVKFKKLKITTLVITMMLSEVIIILGIAALIGWNLDLAAIAGIIATIGTGVDALIILTEETLYSERQLSWKEKVKRAFSIILGAYLTTVVAMITLYWSGLDIVRGFALVTAIGVTVGVFITRPAYGKLIEILND
jgi:preprotein translocase subunit SecD